MEQSTTREVKENEITQLSSTENNEKSIGDSRENSDARKNMDASEQNETITDNIIVSNDDVIIGRAVLTEGIKELPMPKSEGDDTDTSNSMTTTMTLTSGETVAPSSTAKDSLENVGDQSGMDPPDGSFGSKEIGENDWRVGARQSVLHVHCKKTVAELHKKRFGNGRRGKCIFVHDKTWLTPSEFEAYCGRSASKDWKRSIRFQGETLNTLIEEEFIQVHASCCSCAVCLDDTLAAGPVRLYQHYKRRKKAEDELPNPKRMATFNSTPNAERTSPGVPLNVSQLSGAELENVDIDSLTIFPPITDLPLDRAWHEMSLTLVKLLKAVHKARFMLEELRHKTFKELEEQKRILLLEKEEAINQAMSLSSMDGYLNTI